MELQDLPFKTAPGTGRSRWYIGSLMTFLVTAKETGGLFSLTETLMRRGLEPPQHMHTKDDETFYVLDGELKFLTGEKELLVKTGESLFLPRNVPHGFSIQTETARFLVMLTPGGLEEMFMALSVPAEKLELPPRPFGPPPPAVLEKVRGFQKQFGIEMKETPKGL